MVFGRDMGGDGGVQDEWAKDPMWDGTAGVHTQQLSRDAFTEGAPVKRRVGGGRPDAYTVDDAYSGCSSYIEP